MNPTKSKGNEILKRVLGILIIPVLCFGIMELVCLGNGTTIFTGSTTFGLFCRGTVTTLLLSFGVSINMHTGRFDFSTGATMIFGGICGAILSKSTGLGPVGMVVFSVLIMVIVLFFRSGIMGTKEIDVYGGIMKIKNKLTGKKGAKNV